MGLDRSIEDNVRKTCGDIVHDVVVVGAGRPVACLFVEVLESCTDSDQEIRNIILERTKSFNERLFRYEQINDPDRIRLLPMDTLPRTKACPLSF